LTPKNENDERIHDRLYKDKEQYFEKKKVNVDTKLIEEMKECTFSPKI
jgi:hypothetical protein